MATTRPTRSPRPFKSTLGVWIRDHRSARSMSQKDLAAHASISRSYLCDIEHGRGSAPSLHVLQAIARALGEDPAELVMQAGIDMDREDELEPGSQRERRVLTMFRALSPESQEQLERFTRFLLNDEQRWVQPQLTPFANNSGLRSLPPNPKRRD